MNSAIRQASLLDQPPIECANRRAKAARSPLGNWIVWSLLAAALLIGYLSMTRSFAYLGLPQAKLFIGEVALGAFMLLQSRAVFGCWLAALVQPTPLSGVAWGLFLFLGYGLFELLHGLTMGHRPVTALQNLAFNYYPFYLFLGLWLGVQQPTFLPRIIRLLAWCIGLYGTLYILILHRVPWTIPGTNGVPLFSGPGGAGLVLLGLLAFERDLIRVWPLLLLNGFVMLGLQVRAEWLGLLVGLLIWGWMSGHLYRLAIGCMAIVFILGAMYVGDVHLPSPRGRSAGISVQEIVGRGLAPLDPESAIRYSNRAEGYAGTVSWRTTWWQAIWQMVHEQPWRMLIGYGYGFPLGDLVPYLRVGLWRMGGGGGLFLLPVGAGMAALEGSPAHRPIFRPVILGHGPDRWLLQQLLRSSVRCYPAVRIVRSGPHVWRLPIAPSKPTTQGKLMHSGAPYSG
jgi:hypothetical protein